MVSYRERCEHGRMGFYRERCEYGRMGSYHANFPFFWSFASGWTIPCLSEINAPPSSRDISSGSSGISYHSELTATEKSISRIWKSGPFLVWLHNFHCTIAKNYIFSSQSKICIFWNCCWSQKNLVGTSTEHFLISQF